MRRRAEDPQDFDPGPHRMLGVNDLEVRGPGGLAVRAHGLGSLFP